MTEQDSLKSRWETIRKIRICLLVATAVIFVPSGLTGGGSPGLLFAGIGIICLLALIPVGILVKNARIEAGIPDARLPAAAQRFSVKEISEKSQNEHESSEFPELSRNVKDVFKTRSGYLATINGVVALISGYEVTKTYAAAYQYIRDTKDGGPWQKLTSEEREEFFKENKTALHSLLTPAQRVSSKEALEKSQNEQNALDEFPELSRNFKELFKTRSGYLVTINGVVALISDNRVTKTYAAAYEYIREAKDAGPWHQLTSKERDEFFKENNTALHSLLTPAT
jgi:hypothetical protein